MFTNCRISLKLCDSPISRDFAGFGLSHKFVANGGMLKRINATQKAQDYEYWICESIDLRTGLGVTTSAIDAVRMREDF